MENQEVAVIGFAELIQKTQRFINSHWLAVSGLGLAAAVGRYIQAGGAGEISTEVSYLLEIAAVFMWIILAFLVIGNGAIGAGYRAVVSIFQMQSSDWARAWKNLKTNVVWNKIPLIVNGVVLVIIVVITHLSIILWVNLGIAWLKTQDIVAMNTLSWPIVVLLINLSIMPFTVVFACLSGLILVGKNSTI